MTTQDWLLVVSLVLNGALAVILFFKSALNDIVSHWFETQFISA